MAIEFRKPTRSDYDSELDYAMAYGTEVQRYNKAICAAIDFRTDLKTEHAPRARQLTVADYLADRPAALARFRRDPASIFEV
jgi:hypothetical protein